MRRPPDSGAAPGSRGAAVTRRQALGAAAATAAWTVVPRHVLGGPGQEPPSEKLRLAGVGVGGVGFGQLQSCEAAGFRIAALCDVDDVYARKAYDRWPQASRYRDFREMLQAEGDRIDAVYCGTPDHTHAVVTLAALRRRKPVCCVKPLTRTIEECRAVVKAAETARVATQVTAQSNTGELGCRTCEILGAGVIGPVREVHAWTNRPMWPQGMLRPEGQDPVPGTLDWNLWIGPAPMRAFKDRWPAGHLAVRQVPWENANPSVYHPFNFRGWWDFGTGALGDMGCHILNAPFRALRLHSPRRVEATSTKPQAETAPLASVVTYDFPAREDLQPIRVVWYDGGLKPPRPPEMDDVPLPNEGVIYAGDEGRLLVGIKSDLHVFPAARAAQAASVPRTLPRRPGMWKEWWIACKGGQPAGCPFQWAGPLTEFVLLGNIAIRAGKAIQYDPDKARITNDEAANKLLAEPYRNGWSIEA